MARIGRLEQRRHLLRGDLTAHTFDRSTGTAPATRRLARSGQVVIQSPGNDLGVVAGPTDRDLGSTQHGAACSVERRNNGRAPPGANV